MARPTVVRGDVVGGRYEVDELLDDGDGSAVYRAVDRTLSRPVAVRILTYDALESEEWRQYVRHEITAVAALHHPNLTRIFEWGELEGTPYVVTEFLRGGSLEAVLAARGRLTPEQTALIGLEAATALAYAHAREFVHGALRPSKLLFDDEGRVRVNGLGLDSALRATLGTPVRSLADAQYLSPEQVLGVTVEGRSDVYALALILYQCLTGHVPHAGRTLEATRANRIGAALPSRPELGPFDLPLALGAAPEPAARPDADLFASRLAALAATLPVPRPIVDTGFVVPSPAEVLSAPAARVSSRVSGLSPVVRPLDLPGYREAVERATGAPPPSRRRGRVAVALLAAIVLIAAVVGVGLAWRSGAFATTYTVPPLSGVSPAAALGLVKGDQFSIKVVGSAHSSSVPVGDIAHQDPAAGARLDAGSAIAVTISSGPRTVALPAVLALGCKSATNKLHTVGVTATCPNNQQVYSPSLKAGAVVAVKYGTVTNPAVAPVGATVVLVISKGAAPPTTTTSTVPPTTEVVPDVVGDDSAQTESAMGAAQLYYTTVGPHAASKTWTKVLSTNPVAGTTVPYHATVTVTVN